MWSREFVIHYLSDKLNLFLNIEYYSAKFLMRLYRLILMLGLSRLYNLLYNVFYVHNYYSYQAYCSACI